MLVLGMHRSGTSALAGTLQLLGVDLGRNLIPGSERENAKGFFEHAGIVALNERVLAAIPSSWHDEQPLPENWPAAVPVKPLIEDLRLLIQREFGDSSLWGIKDPRVCRLLPAWLPILRGLGQSVRCVMIVRDPREVADSLNRRNGIPMERAMLLWLRYLLDAERSTRGLRRVVITYPELLENWRTTLKHIGETLELNLPLADAATTAKIDGFLEKELRHFAATSETPGASTPLLETVYRAHSLASSVDPFGEPAAWAKLEANCEALTRAVRPWSGEIQRLWSVRAELDSCRSQLALERRRAALLEAEVNRVRATFSWRLTAPMRVGWNLLRHLRKPKSPRRQP